MSFIGNEQGQSYTPGWFLESETGVVRKTRQISAASAETAANGGKYVAMGTVWPANDSTAEGIVYEDVDVSTGDMPGSVVLAGRIYADRLHGTLADAAKTALAGKGFTIIDTAPAVERPY